MRIKYLIIIILIFKINNKKFINIKLILKYNKNKIYKLMRIKIFNHKYLNILN